jgi:hypothetical protein
MRLLRFTAFVLALVLAPSLPAAAQNAPTSPRIIYAVVFGVLFDETGDVRQLRLVKVVEPRKGNADAEGVTIPEVYVGSVRKLLATPRYRPKPDAIKAEEVFTYFFYDPDQPARADFDPRPRRK